MEFKNTIQAMQKLGSNVVREGKGILKRKKKTTSKNTLYNDFDYLVTADKNSVTLEFVFGGAEDYWAFVDEGVRGAGGYKGSGKMRGQGSPFKYSTKQPPLSVILSWVKSKGLTGKSQRGIAFAVARSIKQRGLTRTQFITKPIKEQYKKLPNELTKAFALDLENLLDKAIPKTMNA